MLHPSWVLRRRSISPPRAGDHRKTASMSRTVQVRTSLGLPSIGASDAASHLPNR